VVTATVRVSGLRDAEVDDFHMPLTVHENVTRFEVAVDDAFLMAMLHGVAYMNHQFESLFDRKILTFGVSCDW